MSEGDPRPQVPRPQAPARYYPMPPAPAAEMKPISRWVWIGSAILVLALGGAAIPVYRYVSVGLHKYDPLIAGLHEKMAKGDDAGIFADSDPAYKEQVGRERCYRMLDAVRAQLGAPQSSTLATQDISTTEADGTVMTLTFSTIFEKGVGTEVLKLHKTDGVYRMIGYHVFSSSQKMGVLPTEVGVDE